MSSSSLSYSPFRFAIVLSRKVLNLFDVPKLEIFISSTTKTKLSFILWTCSTHFNSTELFLLYSCHYFVSLLLLQFYPTYLPFIVWWLNSHVCHLLIYSHHIVLKSIWVETVRNCYIIIGSFLWAPLCVLDDDTLAVSCLCRLTCFVLGSMSLSPFYISIFNPSMPPPFTRVSSLVKRKTYQSCTFNSNCKNLCHNWDVIRLYCNRLLCNIWHHTIADTIMVPCNFLILSRPWLCSSFY